MSIEFFTTRPQTWTDLQCSGCGNVVAREDVTTVITGSNGCPIHLIPSVTCGNPICPSYGLELMRVGFPPVEET